MPPLNPKFLLSENLNRLAKWLRLLGYDAAIYKSISTDKMISLAVKERRIILTRSRKIAARKEKFSRILIRSEFHKQQLIELKDYIGFSEKHLFTRCSECNKKLVAIAADQIRNLIPEVIFASHDEFSICRKCGRIYWPGTHYENIMHELEDIFRELK